MRDSLIIGPGRRGVKPTMAGRSETATQSEWADAEREVLSIGSALHRLVAKRCGRSKSRHHILTTAV
jgi:hypothetical protein